MNTLKWCLQFSLEYRVTRFLLFKIRTTKNECHIVNFARITKIIVIHNCGLFGLRCVGFIKLGGKKHSFNLL